MSVVETSVSIAGMMVFEDATDELDSKMSIGNRVIEMK